MDVSNIKNPTVAYHRNGVAGEGFHVVTFTYQGGQFIAIIFGDRGQCAVVGQDHPLDPMRGDLFEDTLREIIDKA